jgi:hypothetical protein
MSIPDDALFGLAILVLTLGTCYELFWTCVRLEPILIAAVRSLRKRLVDAFSPALATPVSIAVPGPAAPCPAPAVAPPTNYLESMSPEEMERFLAEPGV